MSRGRPSIFTPELAATILGRLREGETLRAICRDEGMPVASTVILWTKTREDFAEQYARAREAGYNVMAEQTLEIADDSSRDTYTDDDGNVRVDHEVVNRSRLRVDTRKWLLSKALPKIYGDKLDVTSGGAPLTIATVRYADLVPEDAVGEKERASDARKGEE